MDDARAVYWYAKAADQGNTIAQNNLGAMYYTGEGTKQSKTEAYKWFYIAGELGNDDARDNRALAAKNMRDSEVRKGTRLAERWLKDFRRDAAGL